MLTFGFPLHKRITSLLSVAFLLLLAVGCKPPATDLGDQAFVAQKYETAIGLYTEYLKDHAKHAETWFKRGRAYEEMGQLPQAISDLQEAIKLEPDRLEYLMQLGILYFKQEEFATAAFFMEKALAVKSNHSEAYLIRGRALQQAGKIQDAMESYDNAIRYNRNASDAYLYRGMLKVALRQEKSACADFEKAAALKNPNAQTLQIKHCAK